MKNINKWILLSLVCIISACSNDSDVYVHKNTANEQMELETSTKSILLNEDMLNDVAVTFKWTKAREMPEEYAISYVTKLDVVGNNFATCIRTEEGEGVFSKSYTYAELQNLITNKWGLSVNKEAELEFRVIAKWTGGNKFAMPEVRDQTIIVQPYKPMVYDADKVFISGTAVGSDPVQITRTEESRYKYAYVGQLQQGKLMIPIEYEGETHYVSPKSENSVFVDGEAMPILLKSEKNVVAWDITKAGKYSIVVDLEKRTVKINSPDKSVVPITVQWTKDGIMQNTTVTQLYMYGNATGWSWTSKGILKPSIADPNIFVFKQEGLSSGTIKFGVEAHSQSYVFTCPTNVDGSKQELDAKMNGNYDLVGGYTKENRDSYYKIPAGVTLIIVDLNKMMVRFAKY